MRKHLHEQLVTKLKQKLNERISLASIPPSLWNNDLPWDDWVPETSPRPIGQDLPEPSGPIVNQPIGPPLPRSPYPPNTPMYVKPVDRDSFWDNPIWMPPPPGASPNEPSNGFWWFDIKNNAWRYLYRMPGNNDSWGMRQHGRGLYSFPVRTGDYFWNPETGEFELYMDPTGTPPIWWIWRWYHGMPVG